MEQQQLEATDLTSHSTGTRGMCPNEFGNPEVLNPKKTRLFWE
jgi:hypothetical protein